MMHTRYALALSAALALPFIAGCNTYLQQKADVVSGGPETRVKAAEVRLEGVKDTHIGLKSDHETLAEEQALQDREMAEVNQRLEAQEDKIARARTENKISRAQEQAMRKKVGSLNREIQDVELRLEAARLVADAEQEEALWKRFAELEEKSVELDGEIDLLSQ
jgi:chromosome segregation ATPase